MHYGWTVPPKKLDLKERMNACMHSIFDYRFRFFFSFHKAIGKGKKKERQHLLLVTILLMTLTSFLLSHSSLHDLFKHEECPSVTEK